MEAVFARTRSTSTAYEIEGEVRSLVESFRDLLLKQLGHCLEERDRALGLAACPWCGGRMRRNRLQPRNLQLLEGTIRVSRGYWLCRPCKLHFCPLDLSLDLPRDGEVAPRFSRDLCLLGVELPFEAGARLLEVLTGRQVDPGTIRNQIRREGDALASLEAQEARIHAEVRGARDRARRLKAFPRLHAPPFPGETLVIELDGVHAPVGIDADIRRDMAAWLQRKEHAKRAGLEFQEPAPSTFREVLNARLYRLDDRVRKTTRSGKVRCALGPSETVSVVNDPRFFEQRLYATSEAWQMDLYRIRIALGDGGVFDRKLADSLAATYEILDFFHAKSHIYGCARAWYGEGSPAAKRWGKRWSDSLFDSGPRPLLAELQRVAKDEPPRDEEAHRKLTNLIAYVKNHQLRMRYPMFRAKGFPIASGAIESTNRQVVGDRCKRSGMRWDRHGLQCLLSLRAALLSGTWTLAGVAIRQERSLRIHLDRAQPTALEPQPTIMVDPPIPAPPRPGQAQPRRSNLVQPVRKLALRHSAGLFRPESPIACTPTS